MKEIIETLSAYEMVQARREIERLPDAHYEEMDALYLALVSRASK